MTINWKQTAGALMVSAMTLGVTGGDLAMAKGKSAVLKPTPPDDVTTTERGIKDNGVKSCSGCGMTGRQAAPPATGDGATPPSAEVEVKGGQILEKPPRPHIMEREATPPPVDAAAAPPSAEKGKTGWIIVTPDPPMATDKAGRPKERDDSPMDTSVTERRAHNGPGGTPPSTAKPKKRKGPKIRDDPYSTSSRLLPVVGGVAALAALVAAVGGGGDDNPTSP
jgi:hypothetical protein